MNDAGHDRTDIDSLATRLAAPKFCARCRRKAKPDASLCMSCGEPVSEQGYCPTCERFLLQPVGSFCPKHDVALDVGPPPLAFGQSEIPPTAWVTVGTFDSETEIDPPRVRLEAEGIPTFVEGSRMGSKSMYDVATGGLKLQVPQSLAGDARAILSQTWEPASGDDLDDAWEDLGPDPGEFRRKVMKGVIVLILLGPFILALIGVLLFRR